MANAPDSPKIYHITHVRNLAQIVAAGKLWSDAKRIELGLRCDVVGMSHIKRRRLEQIQVGCHRGTHVGDYVPFYFCPRSIMLYILYRGDHSDLNYTEGQEPIVHLQADLHTVVEWAGQRQRRWAFSDRNAGTRYVNFFNDLAKLEELNWTAITTHQWSDATIKEGKQVEFLLHESFPWELVERIGVCTTSVLAQVESVLASAGHRPMAAVKRDWYY